MYGMWVPLQVLIELQRNLNENEIRGVMLALSTARNTTWDYALAPSHLVQKWEKQGAKKGDAVIAAHLETNNIPLQEAPRYLPQYMEQAYNNLSTSEYYPLRSIVREEIRWSVFGSIRLQYVLNNQLQYFPSFDYNPAHFDYINARRRS
jgi:hypothetical protein